MTLPVLPVGPETRSQVRCERCHHPVPTGHLRQPGNLGPVCWRREHDPPLRLPAIRRHAISTDQTDLFDLIKEMTGMSYTHTAANCADYHDVVVDFHGGRPEIVVLCGSTRFEEEFRREAARLTLAGAIVVKPDVFMNDGHTEKAHLPAVTNEVKVSLDALHKRKIDLADRVLVVSDESGYFGDSTRAEIAYARERGKPVRFVVEAAARRDRAGA